MKFFAPCRPVLCRVSFRNDFLIRTQLTSGSSGSSLGWGTSSTRPNFPCAYLMGLLDCSEVQDSLLVDPASRIGIMPDVWVVAVLGRVGVLAAPVRVVVAVAGRVGGFMFRGCGLRNDGARVGRGGFGDAAVDGREAAAVPGLDVAVDGLEGVGGSGPFGGSVGAGRMLAGRAGGRAVSFAASGGNGGRSFGGTGGGTSRSSSPSCPPPILSVPNPP